MGWPVVNGGENLTPLGGIGLTDLQNIGRGQGALAPLPSPQFRHHCGLIDINFESGEIKTVKFGLNQVKKNKVKTIYLFLDR